MFPREINLATLRIFEFLKCVKVKIFDYPLILARRTLVLECETAEISSR